MSRGEYAFRAPAAAMAVVVIAVCASLVPAAGARAHPAGSGAGSGTAEGTKPLKDRYVVMFNRSAGDEARNAARDEARRVGGKIHHEYNHAVKGFAATLPAPAVEALRRNPQVTLVEPDFEVHVSDSQFPTPSWGLDRVDQDVLPLDHIYSYPATGAGVTVYVIDTGIRTSHTDFDGRASGGFTVINDGRGSGDCNGHGTHVAATIGGTAYGVAKAVKLVPVRVLDCAGSGTMSGVIAGVDWVAAQRISPAVANMSLGGAASTALDAAVASAVAAGTSFVVAAGNDAADACSYSPARVEPAITVGATTSTDTRAGYSNYGACLDLFAPGSAITSAYHSSDTAVASLSGTSMAAPHVAGAAALFLQNSPQALPAGVREAIVGTATADLVREAGAKSPNALLHSAASSPHVPPAANQPPPANQAPVTLAPLAILPLAGTQIGTTTVPLRISWSAIDHDGDGISAYQLQRSTNGGKSWTDVTLSTPAATTVTVRVPTSPSLRYRIRATDGRGLTGAYASGPTITLALLQQNAAVYSAAKAWTSHSITGAYGGTVHRSRTAGSSATFKFTGTQIVWIGTRAATRGKAEIFLDGISQGIIDLYSSATKTRQVLFSRSIGAGSHALTIKSKGTRNSKSSNTYIDIDGFITTR